MFKKIKQVQALLHSHKVAEMPEAMKHRKDVILTVTIVSTIIFDLLSFSLKGAQSALAANCNRLAIGLLILYFVRLVLNNSVKTYVNKEKSDFNSDSDAYITASISEISNTVRGKVFHTKNDYSLIMTNSEINFNLKDFIGYIWVFWQNFPIAVANSVMALVMAITILVTEFLQSGNLKLTIIFSVLLFTCIALFAILFKLRLHVRKNFRDNHRTLKKENEVLMNDVKNIEPLIVREFLYRVKLLVDNLRDKRALEKKEILKLDGLQILRSLVLGVFMILIIVIKLHFAGGIDNLTLAILTDIIAVSTVYSNILDKVASILTDFETITNTIRDAERVKPDVDNIMSVYEHESSICIIVEPENIDAIQVNPFEFSYPGTMSVYMLRNTAIFWLLLGKSYLVYGQTGSGKSTFAYLVIGKILMDLSPISYGKNKDQKAYLASIMHESNGRLGANPVLQEIIFNDDVSVFDQQRMIEILHGTHIYEDIMRNLGLTIDNDEKVLEYLNSTTIEQYSSGQKQRLAIVKVLYNLVKQHQIVVFDEATNALDDNTAISVLKFMRDYCQKDRKRIVLFISHQVELTKKITDGSITFRARKVYNSEGVETILPGAFDIVTEL